MLALATTTEDKELAQLLTRERANISIKHEPLKGPCGPLVKLRNTLLSRRNSRSLTIPPRQMIPRTRNRRFGALVLIHKNILSLRADVFNVNAFNMHSVLSD